MCGRDTVSDERHPFLFPPPGTVAPSAPPWFGSIVDNHTDLGAEDGAEKINNIAGQDGGRVVPFPSRRLQNYETYEESGSYYLCYRQGPGSQSLSDTGESCRNNETIGCGFFEFLKYVVVHIHTCPPSKNSASNHKPLVLVVALVGFLVTISFV